MDISVGGPHPIPDESFSMDRSENSFIRNKLAPIDEDDELNMAEVERRRSTGRFPNMEFNRQKPQENKVFEPTVLSSITSGQFLQSPPPINQMRTTSEQPMVFQE